MNRLYVLYDAGCGICSRVRSWLQAQEQAIPLVFVAAGSEQARRLFPCLEHPEGDPERMTVVDDEGRVYHDTKAYLMCLYAIEGYRDWAQRFARPALLPMTRRFVNLAITQNRHRISEWFGLRGDAELLDDLQRERFGSDRSPEIRPDQPSAPVDRSSGPADAGATSDP